MNSKNFTTAFVPYVQEHKGGIDDVNFSSGKGLFFYPFGIISAYYALSRKDTGSDLRQSIEMKKDVFLIGDSGGFQILSFPEKTEKLGSILSIRNILKWQEENCDVGLIKDIPVPFSLSSYQFKKNLSKTKENILEALKYRESNKLKLFNVLQATTLREMEEWYNTLSIFNKDLDGWGIATRLKNDPLFLAILFCFFIEKGFKKNLHFLGISGPKTSIPIIYYISNLFKLKNITFDSASHRSGGKFRQYFFNNFSDSINLGERLKKNNPGIERLPCNCVVCRKAGFNQLNGSGSLASEYLSLHNLFQMIEYCFMIDGISPDQNYFKEFLKKNNYPERLFQAINFVDLYKDSNLDVAINKYRTELKTFSEKEPKMNSIFDF